MRFFERVKDGIDALIQRYAVVRETSMNMGVPRWPIAAVLCFISAGCHEGVLEKDASFRIVATDAGFDAPERVASGLRHIVFENHGSEIHEAMLVKVPPGMSPSDYVTAVKRGELFPKGAVDCSGLGLTSPAEKDRDMAKVGSRTICSHLLE